MKWTWAAAALLMVALAWAQDATVVPSASLIWAMFTLPKDIEIKLNDPSQEQETWIFYQSEPHQR